MVFFINLGNKESDIIKNEEISVPNKKNDKSDDEEENDKFEDENEEFEKLRKMIPREMERIKSYKHVNRASINSEDNDESSEEEYIELLPETIRAKKQKQKNSVSAEVFGIFNKKTDYKPRVIPKKSETKEKISARLKQAFMFSALDDKEFEIVLDAMEEKHFRFYF